MEAVAEVDSAKRRSKVVTRDSSAGRDQAAKLLLLGSSRGGRDWGRYSLVVFERADGARSR